MEVASSTHIKPASNRQEDACIVCVESLVVPECAGGKDEPDNKTWIDEKFVLKKEAFDRRQCVRLELYKQHQQ